MTAGPSRASLVYFQFIEVAYSHNGLILVCFNVNIWIFAPKLQCNFLIWDENSNSYLKSSQYKWYETFCWYSNIVNCNS